MTQMRMFMFVFMNKVAILGSALYVADSTILSGPPSLGPSRFDWHIGSPDLFTQSPFKGQHLWLINSSNPCLIHKIARADPGSVIVGAHVVTNLKRSLSLPARILRSSRWLALPSMQHFMPHGSTRLPRWWLFPSL
jgi:hypothetical protein